MADMIEGNTGHANFAPLSSAQTVAISRHLQEQIRALESRMDDMMITVQEVTHNVGSNKEGKDWLNDQMEGLKDNLAGTKAVVDSTRKELGRTNANVQKLQSSMETAHEGLATQRDLQKVTNTAVQKLSQDVSQTDAVTRRIQEHIEKKLDLDAAQLREQLSQTSLVLQQLRADERQTKDIVCHERETLRETNSKVKANSDELQAVETKIGILENRLAESATGLKTTRQHLEDLNTVTLKLHEDHENTKTSAFDVLAGLKRVGAHVKQVHEGLEKTANVLDITQGKLEDNTVKLDDVHHDLRSTGHQVSILSEGHELSKNQLNHLHKELAEVGATAQAVKAGLKETSSILLPNINMDHTESRTASARHGSLLTGNAGMNFNNSSPKKSAPPAKAANAGRLNVGSNQMAWT